MHQFVAGYAARDAISNEARVLRTVFRSWGYESTIFSEARHVPSELRGDTVDVSEAAARIRGDDVVLLHLSIGSSANEVFASLPCRKAILYHNVTPPHYFETINPQTAFALAKGLKQVKALAGAAEVNLADSRFNAGELEAVGYRDVSVLPLVLDFSLIGTPPNRRVLRQLQDGRPNVIFVGRGAPNKRLEDVLSAFACLKQNVEPTARLLLAGSFAGTEPYLAMLMHQARGLDSQAADVVFLRSVPQDVLSAVYRSASVFLCMSEHEGFCIPVIEAMAHDVPVVAYAAAAVPETMDGAGVLFDRKDMPGVAEMMGRLIRDATLRNAVLTRQRERIARFRARNLETEVRQRLAPLLPAGLGSAGEPT
jgi:glycosyltransferase involved in cell wall biosynthesis